MVESHSRAITAGKSTTALSTPPASKTSKVKSTTAPLPTMFFAGVAAAGLTPLHNRWTEVTKPNQTRLAPLFKPEFRKVQWELINELSALIFIGITAIAIMTSANAAQACMEVKFYLAPRTTNGNILLVTLMNITSSSAETYISPRSTALSALACNSSTNLSNFSWTQFLLHGVPTTATPQEITTDITQSTPLSHL